MKAYGHLAVILLTALAASPATALAGRGQSKGREKQKARKTEKVLDQDRGRFGKSESIRFRGQDRNGDGVITREEWRGNDTSFARHDRNGDGILSGDEVRPGARGDREDDEFLKGKDRKRGIRDRDDDDAADDRRRDNRRISGARAPDGTPARRPGPGEAQTGPGDGAQDSGTSPNRGRAAKGPAS